MTVWPKATRAQIIARAKDGYGDGLQHVPYSQQNIVHGYRADCSGYASRCLGLTSTVGHGFWGGLNTITLVSSGAVKKIKLNDLKPGDLCGNMGDATQGDAGHVVIFDRWLNDDPADDRYYIYEQCGGTIGPIHRLITWPYPGEHRWAAYRYIAVQETTMAKTFNPQDLPAAVRETWHTDGTIEPVEGQPDGAAPGQTAAGTLHQILQLSHDMQADLAALRKKLGA